MRTARHTLHVRVRAQLGHTALQFTSAFLRANAWAAAFEEKRERELVEREAHAKGVTLERGDSAATEAVWPTHSHAPPAFAQLGVWGRRMCGYTVCARSHVRPHHMRDFVKVVHQTANCTAP